MATYRGGELPQPQQPEDDLKMLGGRVRGLDNVEEELGLPPDVGTERTRRPGEKGYMKEQHMAETSRDKDMLAYARGAGRHIKQHGLPDRYIPPGKEHEMLPVAVPSDITRPSFNRGGMVKHGSTTRVSCKGK